MSYPSSIDAERKNEPSGIVTGKASVRISVTNLLDEYMRITECIDAMSKELKQLKEQDKKDTIEALQENLRISIEERKKLRADLNKGMDKLEKDVETIGNTAEAARNETVKISDEFDKFKSDMNTKFEKQNNDLQTTMKNKDQELQSFVFKIEENHKKELHALESRMQQTVQELLEKEKKSRSEEIASLQRGITSTKLELIQQIRTQGKYQFEAVLANITRRSSIHRPQDRTKRLSLPSLNLSLGGETSSLLPTFTGEERHRHISETSSDSGCSHTRATTPENENTLGLRLKQPPSAHPGRVQDRVPTPLPRIRPKSWTESIMFPESP